MLIRSAFWTGRPHNEAAFRSAIEERQVPLLRSMPGVADARALWVTDFEEAALRHYCHVMVMYQSKQELDRMMASPERQKLREVGTEIMGMFEGQIGHVIYESDDRS